METKEETKQKFRRIINKIKKELKYLITDKSYFVYRKVIDAEVEVVEIKDLKALLKSIKGGN